VSRTLKRPMFRRGGTVNDGIMTGLVDRKQKSLGGLGIDRARTEAEMKMLMDLQNQYAPVPKTRLPVGQFGLNLASGMSLVDSLKDPYSSFVKQDDARRSVLNKRKTSALSTSVGQQFAERAAKAKAAGTSGFLKEEPVQRAYENFLKDRIDSKNDLKSFQKPNIYQKYAPQTAEFDSYVSRNLRSTTNPTGKMIANNFVDYVPFDIKTQSFDYNAMQPGAFYYDPRQRAFVQRIPASDEDEGGFFLYDKTTFAKRKIETNT